MAPSLSEPWSSLFAIGSVRWRGSDLPNYRSLVARTQARIPYQGNEKSTIYPCPVCGRRCEMVIERWIRASDFASKFLATGTVGVPVLISEAVVDSLPKELHDELRLNPIPVR